MAVNMDVVLQVVILIGAVGLSFLAGYAIRKARKDHDIDIRPEDLDIARMINSFIRDNVVEDEIAIKVSKVITGIINVVEKDLEGASREEKVDAIYYLSVEAIRSVGIESELDEETLKQVIGLLMTFIEPLNKEEETIVSNARIRVSNMNKIR